MSKTAGRSNTRLSPCANGHDTLEQGHSVEFVECARKLLTSAGKKKCVGRHFCESTFANIPVRTLLRVLADFSGNKLEADASVTGSGAFSYDCVPWDAVLRDAGARY